MSKKAPASPQIAGWHGKLPSLGDFAQRRLSPRFVETWDAWLQACLAAQRLPAQDCERPVPVEPLRFWLSPGLCDRQALCGVIVASHDRVGRAFPLTLASTLPTISGAFSTDDPGWFDRGESLLQRAVDTRMSLEAFEAELVVLPPLAGTADSGARADGIGSLWWSRRTHATPIGFAALPPTEAAVALLESR